MEISEAYDLISAAIDSGMTANAYLICGNVSAECEPLAEKVLLKLFPDAQEQIKTRTHPDVFRLEPQGKSRTIKVEKGDKDKGPGMRDGMIEPMSRKSFAGGWKAGIVSGADRMQPAAANAFLKTLEEPPEKTLFLLLADTIESILPTIVSRSQRIDLPGRDGDLDEALAKEVEKAFSSKSPVSVERRNAMATSLANTLKKIEDELPEPEIPVLRRTLFRKMLSRARDWMAGGEVELFRAFRNIEAIETAYRRYGKSMSGDAVLADMFDRIAFP